MKELEDLIRDGLRADDFQRIIEETITGIPLIGKYLFDFSNGRQEFSTEQRLEFRGALELICKSLLHSYEAIFDERGDSIKLRSDVELQEYFNESGVEPYDLPHTQEGVITLLNSTYEVISDAVKNNNTQVLEMLRYKEPAESRINQEAARLAQLFRTAASKIKKVYSRRIKTINECNSSLEQISHGLTEKVNRLKRRFKF